MNKKWLNLMMIMKHKFDKNDPIKRCQTVHGTPTETRKSAKVAFSQIQKVLIVTLGMVIVVVMMVIVVMMMLVVVVMMVIVVVMMANIVPE